MVERKMLPAEPTPEMLAAVLDPEDEMYEALRAQTVEDYRAMYAAAPEVQVAAGDDSKRGPSEPPPGLLMSMALRYDHGLGCPGFYDSPLVAEHGVSHAKRLVATLGTMRQLWEETSGNGFYRPELEAHYVGLQRESERPPVSTPAPMRIAVSPADRLVEATARLDFVLRHLASQHLCDQLVDLANDVDGFAVSREVLMRRIDDAIATSKKPVAEDDAKSGDAAVAPLPWRCFHCDETFSDAEAARDHFGRSEHQQPGCQIDVAEYRRMEETHRRHCEEDTDLHRELASLQHARNEAAIRAEEEGYARGLADAKKHPAELGLMVMPAAAEPASPPAGRTHTTDAGESVAGIALRQLRDEKRWREIAELNADRFPDMGASDYYPVGTLLRLPELTAQPEQTRALGAPVENNR